MNLSELFHSDLGLAFIGTVLGGAWALFKSSDWFNRRRNARRERALEALEAGVEETYRTYVAAIKAARADGKLTEDERRHARHQARDRAIAFGLREGVDVLRELGEDYLDLWITRLVAKHKHA